MTLHNVDVLDELSVRLEITSKRKKQHMIVYYLTWTLLIIGFPQFDLALADHNRAKTSSSFLII